jgi:hypothetical protein
MKIGRKYPSTAARRSGRNIDIGGKKRGEKKRGGYGERGWDAET